jgi:hypothetical protein
MNKCADCGADIVWFKSPHGKNVPFNSESPPDEDQPWNYSSPSHWDTCRKPKEKPLTAEQKQRPGYL